MFFVKKNYFGNKKSRANWLKEGDKNTKFFHATTKQRRARNRIAGLQSSDGTWIETEEGIESEAIHYFSNLFTASPSLQPSQLLRDIPVRVSSEMNDRLSRDVTESEIKKKPYLS